MSDLFSVAGKRVLITGGTSGIGLACAEEFVKAGARVVVASENATACAASETSLQRLGDARAICADVGTRSATLDLADKAEAEFGGIDVLLCNAGIEGHVGPLADLTEADWHRIMAINLESAIWLTGRIAPKMAAQRGGSIILMSSLSALRGNGMIGSYAMTKAALIQLARNLAVSFGPNNVRANAIAPGLIETPFSKGLMSNKAFMARRMAATPLRRVGQPDEIAGAALYLASPAGAFMTGQTLVVDGGTVVSDGS